MNLQINVEPQLIHILGSTYMFFSQKVETLKNNLSLLFCIP